MSRSMKKIKAKVVIGKKVDVHIKVKGQGPYSCLRSVSLVLETMFVNNNNNNVVITVTRNTSF